MTRLAETQFRHKQHHEFVPASAAVPESGSVLPRDGRRRGVDIVVGGAVDYDGDGDGDSDGDST